MRTLVVVDLLDAVVLLLDVVRLLLLKVLHHAVDLLSHLRRVTFFARTSGATLLAYLDSPGVH